LWRQIDEARSYVWIVTYAFDTSFTGQLTLKKLIEAQRRGVNCVLFVDDLQQYVDKKLIHDFTEAGGQFKSLNPTWRHFYRGNVPTQEFFRRHHEKLTVIDDFSIIGSSNF
jgi:cardiolipin synthase